MKRCEEKSMQKVDENEFQWEWKRACWIFTTSEVVCDGLITRLAHCKGSAPPASASSDSIYSFFLTGMGFFFNYLDDSHPNWVYFGDETDLDETQHLVFVSSLSQSFTHGWKVDWWQVLSALDLFLLQMLGGISPVITDLGYDHRNAGITRTRPDQMPVCSSFPPPNASETAGNFTGITHAAMHLQGKLVCASLYHL